MKGSFAVTLGLLLLGLVSISFPSSASGQEAGWTTLRPFGYAGLNSYPLIQRSWSAVPSNEQAPPAKQA